MNLTTFCLQDVYGHPSRTLSVRDVGVGGAALVPPGSAAGKALVPQRSNPVVISPFVTEGSSSRRKQKGGPIAAPGSPRVSAIPSGFLGYHGS